MPIYEYRCRACRRPASIFFRSMAAIEDDPACPHCGARSLERRMSRVWVHRGSRSASDASDVDSFDDGPGYADPYGDGIGGGEDDDLDPVAFAREAREMAQMMGEPLDAEFEDALRHIEQGADPEDVLGEMDATAGPTDDEPESTA